MSGEVERQSSIAGQARIAVNPAAIALARAGGELAVRWWNNLARAQDALPITLVAGIAMASFAWNVHAGLNFAPTMPLATLLIITIAFFGIAAAFSFVWSRPLIVELTIYFSLWANFSFFGVRLTYLAATLDFPLQDKLFAQADMALGFNWLSWVSIAWSHQTIINVLILAYQSLHYQCFVLVFVFALCGPRGRNRELLTATIIALLLTVAISTVFPTLGVFSVLGIPSRWETILRALRAGSAIMLPDAGVISFPSFHSSMAVLLAVAMRHNRWGFAAALILNGLMLVSTVPVGDHFFVDTIGGCAVGFASFYLARATADRANLRTHTAQQFAARAAS